MKAVVLLNLLGLATLAAATPKPRPQNHELNDYYVLHLDANASPDQVAMRLGLVHEGELGELKDHHIFSGGREAHDIVKREVQLRRRRKRDLNDRDILDGLLFSQKQALRKPWEKRIVPPRALGPRPRDDSSLQEAAVKKQSELMETLGIRDPIFHEQWHLFNTMQPGHDVNVSGVWLQGVTGKNATVAIVDDGLDMDSEDLKANYYAAGSYDFNDKTDEPRPRLADDRHGTRCAGEVSAVKNNVCGVGVAYDSKIAGIRILSKAITDADEAIAMNYDFQHNQIYSCSWGPPDDGKSMDAPGILIRRAMLNGVQNGRGGLGSIYVFASGNGAGADDNCNFDGYTNSIYSITVGAIDRKGLHPYYSEKCSAGLVVTYSSGSGDAIHTTDVGTNTCYSGHGGTSAAAPLAAGIFALALQVNSGLTWRDMQYLAMDTAIPVDVWQKDEKTGQLVQNPEWQNTTIGKMYSHTFAYGKIDTYALVEAAKTWKNVKPQAWFYSPWIHVHQPIPQGEQGLAVTYEVTANDLKVANLERLEHVTVTMNIAHTRRGDISVDLISPNKIVSHLSVPRRFDELKEGYVDWTFMSTIHWGESGIGKWTIIVRDTQVNEYNGSFTDWHMKLWGESLDASKAKPLDMPTEEDDNDHDKVATTTLSGSTTTVAPNPATSDVAPPVTANPTDHIDRPTKPTGNPDEQGSSPTDTPAAQTSSSSWLPSFLSNLSTKTQIWIYGALGLIVAFCCGLGIYLYMARRKRLRNNPRDDYEFELLDDEEAKGLNGGEKTFAGKKGRKTRGGELYDAFAGGSENEEEFGDDGGYHDRSAEDDDEGGEDSNEKSSRRRDLDDEDAQHVIGEDSDEEEEQDQKLLGRR